MGGINRMSIVVLKIMLILGIIGHAINMYCDRILSIFPNGTINFGNIKEIREGNVLTETMEGVSEKVTMRSAVLGAFALVLEFMGYSSLAYYVYGYAKVNGSIMLAMTAFFCIIAAAYHVKTALVEYVFIKLGKDEKAKGLALDLMGDAPILRGCMLGLIVYIVTFIVSIVTGVIGFPMWAIMFTIIPVFILMIPFRIIGTIHIASMVSMFVWLILM